MLAAQRGKGIRQRIFEGVQVVAEDRASYVGQVRKGAKIARAGNHFLPIDVIVLLDRSKLEVWDEWFYNYLIFIVLFVKHPTLQLLNFRFHPTNEIILLIDYDEEEQPSCGYGHLFALHGLRLYLRSSSS